ncbi:nucleoside kinase [Dethiosulfovibrio salsuginis]|uniref:Uridine kinase n=1 Tax=Dethiosulfovibrio salsuginis TaxID=561720 RepID=A0A1X7JLH2_9BACT|nr:nucleoside kinase [Dethiosulfovibrio salsuginis]SMG29022.1 uridine kinase [Dethiosulfovibrio salsuginis]
MSFKVKIKGFSSIQCDMPLSGQGILASTGLYRNRNIVAWRVNNYLRPLEWVLDGESSVEFVDTNSFEGTMVYRSSLGFLLLLATRKALGKSIFIRHSISEGHFWEFSDGEVTEEDLEAIKVAMADLVEMDIPISREVVSLDKACRIFQRQGNPEKGRLFSRVSMDPIEVYRCLDMYGFFYCPLVPSTGYLKNWGLKLLSPGMVLQFPTVAYPTSLPPFQASKKLSEVFLEYANWLKTMGVSSMVNLHDAIAEGKGQELMLISEAFHSQRLSHLADEVVNRGAALVCIAGPSASGKTTTSKRLKIQLQVCGKRPVTLSLDDYFVDRDKTPLDEKGEYDFEALEALDLELLNLHLNQLLSGQEVQLPQFDFVTGSRKEGKILKLDSDDILIIEGIHGLNDRVTQEVAQDKKFRIFVSPLTGVSLDRQNRTSTTDNRLFRRMIRDHRTRGHSPEATLKRWPSVIRGAQKYIFPYQKHSDVMFNSALLYELPVLKGYLEPLLQTVPEDSPLFGESRRLLSLLRFVPPLPSDKVPNESILREFIGGSLFED